MDFKIDPNNIEAFKTMPSVKSPDTDWIKWSDLVMGKYGRKLGSQIFIAAWTKRGSNAANTLALRQHLKKEYDIEVDESIWNKVADLGGGISDAFGKIFKVGKITLIVGGSVLAIAVIAAVYNTVKGGVSPLKALKK